MSTEYGEHVILIYVAITFFCGFLLVSILGLNKNDLLKKVKRSSPEDLITFIINSSSPAFTVKDPPRYKFYSEIVDELIRLRSQFGAEIRDSLRDIRKALVTDLREEKKITEAVHGGYFQYLIMCLFIWGFIFAATEIVEFKQSLTGVEYILIFQIVGGLGLIVIIKTLRFKYFSPFANYFRAIYQMKLFLGVNRPISEVTSIVSNVSNSKKKEFVTIENRMELLCTQIKSSGRIDKEEIEYLLSELWDHLELQFMKFSKQLGILKMLSLLLFVLPSFFICIALIFSQLKVFG